MRCSRLGVGWGVDDGGRCRYRLTDEAWGYLRGNEDGAIVSVARAIGLKIRRNRSFCW